MKKEYCGLFGIYGHPEAARMTYFGLYALQHRGQESAGIVTWDGTRIREQRGMGLVADVFSERHLGKELKGTVAVGHIRYSTTGASLLRNCQPFLVRFGNYNLAIAHNGNLVNTMELREELEASGSIFQTTIDSEVIVHLIAKYLNGCSLEEAVIKACNKVKGSYSLLLLCNDKIIAVRDPHGIRPLMLGRMGDAYVLASETCAFDLMEAEAIRSVAPGEMLVIQDRRLQSYRICDPQPVRQCVFELVYFARPDSEVFGEVVYERRKQMGCTLASEAPVDADYVMPFPDSGFYAAIGYSQASGLPFEMSMVRNHYVGRTFIQPSQDMRDFSVRVKLNPVKSMIKGKRILIVEDSIVRGTTIRTRVKRLRELGAREIHMRVSCPPIRYPCFYGIDFSSKGELIAAHQSVDDIARFIGLDSLHYLSIEGLLESVRGNSQEPPYCMACFDGNYIIPPCGEGLKTCLDDVSLALSWQSPMSFNIDLASAKDKSLSKLLLSAAKPFLAPYGEVLALEIKSGERSVRVDVLPLGESEPIRVELAGYGLATDETGRGWLTFQSLTTSREWLTRIADKALAERRIKLPSATPMAMLQAML